MRIVGTLYLFAVIRQTAGAKRLMEEVCERENLKEALRQVKSNKGSAGVDGITVNQLTDYLKQHWPWDSGVFWHNQGPHLWAPVLGTSPPASLVFSVAVSQARRLKKLENVSC